MVVADWLGAFWFLEIPVDLSSWWGLAALPCGCRAEARVLLFVVDDDDDSSSSWLVLSFVVVVV